MRAKRSLGEHIVRCETCGSRAREVWTSSVPDSADRNLYPAPTGAELDAYRELARWATYDLRPDWNITTPNGNRGNPYEGPYFELKERLQAMLGDTP